MKRFVKSNEAENNLHHRREPSPVQNKCQGSYVRKIYEEIVGEDLQLPGAFSKERGAGEQVVKGDTRLSTELEPTSEDDSFSYTSSQEISKSDGSSLSNFYKPSLNSLMRHAEQNNHQILRKALKQDQNLINSVDQFGWSLLMVASCAGADKVVQLLLSSGADTKYRDRRGDSCFSLARKKGHMKIVELIQKFRTSKPPSQVMPNPNTIKKTHTQSQLCSSCNLNYDKSSQESHLTSTVHQLSTCSRECRTFYSIPGNNRGYQLMLKEGWDGEKGLGPSGNGIKLPPKTVLKRDRKGLGASKGLARITHFHSNDPRAVIGNKPSKICAQSKEKKYHLRQQIQHDKILERSLRRELS